VAQVLAERELLESISFLVVSEANEAPDDSMVGEVISVGDYAHFNEVLRINTLLQHVVDPVLAQSLHCCLMLLDWLLDVG